MARIYAKLTSRFRSSTVCRTDLHRKLATAPSTHSPCGEPRFPTSQHEHSVRMGLQQASSRLSPYRFLSTAP